MADVQHSELTGASLHEPKGVAAADANRVYVSDGAGSGSWIQAPLDALSNSAKAFQAQLLHVRDSRSSGTNGDNYTSGAWRTRIINTSITNEISGASLSSNQITLPEGTYYIEAQATCTNISSEVNRYILKLRNTTDSSDTLIGMVGDGASNNVGSMGNSILRGRFTIAGTKVFEIQQRSTQNTRGGTALGVGVSEVYLDAVIWKIA